MTMMDRRMALITAAGIAALPTLAGAQTNAAHEVIDLWPGPPPGDTGARIVRKIDVLEGAHVKAGQPLIDLDPTVSHH